MEKKLGYLWVKEKIKLDSELEKEMQHHWRNLIAVVNAYLQLKEEKRRNLRAEMQRTVTEHLEELEKISQKLEKIEGAEKLNVKLKEILIIIKEMKFDSQEREDYSLQKYREEKFSRLKDLIV